MTAAEPPRPPVVDAPGSPGIIGEALTLNNEPHTVIGVMPEGLWYPDVADLWTLFQFDTASHDRANHFEVIARLRPETTLDQARATMDAAGGALRQTAPDLMDATETIGIRPLQERLYGDLCPSLLMLLAAAALVPR